MQRTFASARCRQCLLAAVLLGGVGLSVHGGWIYAKALLAQQLIARAWTDSLRTGSPQKPWPWADTWPAGHLRIERLGVDLYTLAGLGGNALAFGPGQLTLADGDGPFAGLVLAGHRDTHFRFMRELATRDEILFTDINGRQHRYRIVALEIVDSRRSTVQLTAADQLMLITCYPFDALDSGGPLRFVARAAPQPTMVM